MFKKSMSMLLACAMCITMLASCGKKAASEQASKTEPNSVPAQSTSQPKDKPAEKADATKLVIDKAGDYTAEKGVKDVEIKADGVKLTKSTGLNSVTIGKEVGAGSVTLDGVEAKSILIKGGGKNSIHILGSKFEEAILEQMNALTRIVTDAKSTIGEMQANSPAILEIEGTVKSLTMGKDAKDSTIDIKEGATLTNLMLNALTTVNASANITTVSVYASAVGSTLTVTAGATVATLATETKMELKGKGRITAAITQSRANLVGNLKAGTVTVNETPVLTTGMPNTAGGTATGAPTVKPIPPVTPPVTPPADTTPDEKADKTKLGDMLKYAIKDAAKVGTIWVQAENKNEAKADQHYVTKAQVDAYAEALKAAQAIYDDANATQKQVDDAQTSIANANATFMAAGLNQKGVGAVVTVTSIELVKAPNKTLYNDKDKLELDGMQCKLTRSDGTTLLVDAKDFAKNNITTVPAQGEVLAGEQTVTTKPKDIVVTAKYNGTELKDNTTVKVYAKDIHYVDSQASFEAALKDSTIRNVLVVNNADVTVPNKAMRGGVYVEVSSGATLRDYENLGNIQDDTSVNYLLATYGSFVRTGTGNVDNLLFGAKGSGAGLELESSSFMSFVLSKPQKIWQVHIIGGNATIQQQNKQPFIIKDGMSLSSDVVTGTQGTLKIAAADNSATQPSAKKATLEIQGSGKLIIVVPNTLELMPGALVIADKGKDNFEISGTVTNNAGACDNTTVKGLVGMVDKQLNTVTPDKLAQIDEVTISGNTVYGETLTANITYVVQPDKPIDYEYLWCADDVTISGETSSTLILNDISYIGKKIKVIVWPKIGNVMGMNWCETSTVISEKADATPDKTKLGDMLKVAAKDAAKVGTIWVQAENEFNAITHQHYVTKAQVDAYAEAIKAAQAIFDDAKATQKQVDDAQSSITTANATFTAAGQSQVGRMVWFGIDVFDNVTYETTKDGIVYRGVQTQLRFRDVDAKSVLKDTDKVEVSISYGENANKKVLAYSTSKPGKKATTEIFNNTIGKVKDCATIFFAPNALYPSDLWDTTNWTDATIADKPTNVFVSVYRTEYEVLKELNKVETGAKDKYLLISQTYKPDLTLNEKFTDATSKNPIAWADVVPKAPTLSFAEAAKSVTYGDAKFTNKATLSEGTDAISYKSSNTSIATVDAATGEVTVLKNGKVTIEATSINTATHIIAAKGYELTIANKRLIVRGATPKAKIYDGNTDIVLENCTLDGIVGTDEVTLDTSTGTAAAKIGTVAVTEATFTLSGKDKGKYMIAYPPISGTVTISPKALTVKGTTAVEKMYDGKTDVALIDGTLEGVVGKDVVTLATLTGKAAAANVAAAAVVNTDYTIEGADKANYTIKQPSGVTVNITRAPVTITGVTATKTYDGTKAVTLTGTPVLDGVIAADKATATLKAGYPTAGTVTSADWTGKPEAVAIGTYALEGIGASNYALTQPTVQVTIAKATLTAPTDTTKPTASKIAKVNDKLSTSIITGTKALCGETVVEGAWAWKDGTISVDKSGPQTAVFTPTSTNYALLEAQIQVDVIPAQP